MLVIHPKDKTTDMLRALYNGLDARVLDQSCSNREVKDALNHASCQERILLLGHGSDKGLFSREDEDSEDFDRLIVNHSHTYYLRKHRGSIVGIWCHADIFARKEGLHGLFSGMIITDKKEAEEYGVETTQEELDRENEKLACRLRELLDTCESLHMVPQRIRELDDVDSPLTRFNYSHFYSL